MRDVVRIELRLAQLGDPSYGRNSDLAAKRPVKAGPALNAGLQAGSQCARVPAKGPFCRLLSPLGGLSSLASFVSPPTRRTRQQRSHLPKSHVCDGATQHLPPAWPLPKNSTVCVGISRTKSPFISDRGHKREHLDGTWVLRPHEGDPTLGAATCNAPES